MKIWTRLTGIGYPMAKNLRAKIAESDTLIVYDVTTAATDKLKKEAGNVEVAQSVREVAEKAVRRRLSILSIHPIQSSQDDTILFYL